ncbi:MAG: hypothetical protein QW168_02125 [Sulfolobales archaeon]
MMGPQTLPHLPRKAGEDVLRHLERVLLPRVIGGNVVMYYVRKAVRVRFWRSLIPEPRALLRAASVWRSVVKSKVLGRILGEIFLLVELETLRGRALLYGALVALRSDLQDLLDSVEGLLRLGVSYLTSV